MSKIKRWLSSPYGSHQFWYAVLRITVGLRIAFGHGLGKMTGGSEKWMIIGSLGLKSIGVESFHTFFGFMASFSEFVGGILLAIGFLVRPSAILLTITMAFAVLFHFKSGEFGESAAIYGILFLYFGLTGPGRFSVDSKLFGWKK
ncbi:MAG TPA: DoxX family protein [Candidatus Marinimicrobia bacterium]|jgi:putative oxidoreductase|nr:DoxX family protein [Candidatus Neomarinimicrobiota bacterium]MDP6261577.1 DoxX family protein [Candidatus Neomarinimicrobiota bacterium]MDP7127901.1 DoxX family protein [Candidatus Neomarinimicrobiota bacterium]MDP7336325.1 DoxX family protein [Candidatus Neomarinimicrobiota bacterium]MDP7475210.1 DoxX family protein [Candidatus Neomarinimicrobiota bacterium]|tara:strand:- start:24 stop:458 length:435 start_codon:yes stop_codon:yes gene_type:complete